MTAEVAILNKHGVALAADSALTVTVSGERKVYNTGNKLFALSKYHPIGIMIYNNATFMDIDWEIIIKQFRRKLKTNSYPTLSKYADEFLKFVKNFKPISKESQKDLLTSMCYDIFSRILNFFIKNLEKKFPEQKNITQSQITGVLISTIKEIQNIQKSTDNEGEIKLNHRYILTNKNLILKIMNKVFEKYSLTKSQKENIINIFINDVQRSNIQNFTGIVISGYGENEIFPSLYSYHICGKLGNSFIYTKRKCFSITPNNSAFIFPFAQSEMVHSFMGGIDPDFEKIFLFQLNNVINSISNIMDESYKKKLNTIEEEFIDYVNNFKQKVFISPIMDIVNSLQKTDIAEMAESLVNLTSFKRHVSRDTETVGGPTDVAVITKGDGFIWIKRKQYFDKNIKQHLLENYFKEVKKKEKHIGIYKTFLK
ncbi:MAG: hypothetical protein LBQ87_01145 [Candidatus Fibromonas sp.]|jgi:hypothetical protein|nr:hypothetical protein [Candidatus Fibromonas sp.]